MDRHSKQLVHHLTEIQPQFQKSGNVLYCTILRRLNKINIYNKNSMMYYTTFAVL